MKCPECDFEQPDDSLYCAQCGLSIEAWREMNPEAESHGDTLQGAAPSPESSSTAKESAPPAPKEESKHTSAKVEPQPAKGNRPPSLPKKEYPSSTHPEPGSEEKKTSPEAETSSDEPPLKHGFQWTLLHSVGLGVFLLMATNVFFCVRRHQALSTLPEPTPVAVVAATPEPSPTLAPPTPTVTPVPEVKALPAKTTKKKSAPTPTEEPQEPTPTFATDVPKEISESAPSENVLLVPTEEPTATPIPEAKPLSDQGESNGPTDLLESSEPLKVPTSQPTP